MAIWQYTFQILRKENLSSITQTDFNSDEGFDSERFWKMFPLKKTFFDKINSFLALNKSWTKDIDLYGHQKSNCFEVLSDDQSNVLSVSFRIDFSTNYQFVLSQIIEFCILNGLIILTEDLQILPLNYEQINSVVQNSSQAKKYNKLLSPPPDGASM